MKKFILCLFAALLFSTITVQAEEDADENESKKNPGDINEIVSDVPVNKEVSGSIYGSIYGVNDDIVIDVSNQKGADKADKMADENEAYYEWFENNRKLTIYKALFNKAKQTEKNIVMRILDNENHSLEYRVRVFYKDIKDKDVSDIEIEFGAQCEHKEVMKELLISAEARAILSCKQKDIGFPVFVGVAVPKKWDHGYGIYHYVYQPFENELELQRNDLKIDEDNVVEIPLEPGKDNIFYNHVLPVEEKNLLMWVKGLSSGSSNIDGGIALKAIIAFSLGVLLIVGNTMLFIRYKKQKQLVDTTKYSYDK